MEIEDDVKLTHIAEILVKVLNEKMDELGQE